MLVAVSVAMSCDWLKSVMIRLSTASELTGSAAEVLIVPIAVNSNAPRGDVMNAVRRLNLTGIDQRCREYVEEGVLRKPALGIREAVDLGPG